MKLVNKPARVSAAGRWETVRPWGRDAAAQAMSVRPAGAGSRLAWGLLAAWALSACGPAPPSDTVAAAATQAADPSVLPEPLVELDGEGLRARAAQALRERRIHTPAGDSAVDYYLALRDKEPGQIDVISALGELQPYVVIAGEQALLDEDLGESQRLFGLLERMDPQAPALPRLREGLRAAGAMRERKTREETQRLLAERTAAARTASAGAGVAAAGSAGPGSAGSGSAAIESTVAGSAVAGSVGTGLVGTGLVGTGLVGTGSAAPGAARAASKADAAASALAADEAAARAGTRAAPVPVAAPVASANPAPARVSATNPPPRAMPRLIADASPRYPLSALNRKIEGSVEISFTIRPDGRTGAARLVASQPDGVFDEAALAAVARMRFKPSAQSHAARRTLNFKLPSR